MPIINESTRVRFCLCYPDKYENAMADMKPKILYHMLNDRKGYMCERCFAPQKDMGLELRKENYPLFSLETKTPLKNFDVLAFYFPSELTYTNFLYMLDLANISLLKKDRDKASPLVYGYGKCMYNVEPLAPFLDFAIIGDEEDVTFKVIEAINKARLNKLSKEQTLKLMAEIEGVYVPSLITPEFDKAGNLTALNGNAVKRQIVRDLDRAYYPTKLLILNEKDKNEVAVIEPSRGCTRGCRFCVEGYTSRPVRERRVQTLMSHASAQINNSGLDEIYLDSPRIRDYSALASLLKTLDPFCKAKDVKILSRELSASENKEYKSVARPQILKLDLEAGTERLRDIINRTESDENIEKQMVNAFSSGVTKLEFNFMIGLPFENANDLMGIVNLIAKAKLLYKQFKISTKPLNIFVHVDIFVPKPFTPFQWCRFVGASEAEKRMKYLEIAFKKLGVKSYQASPKMAEVEALLSRGDRKASAVLLVAYKKGAIFDNDKNLFDYNKYLAAYYLNSFDKEKVLSKKDYKDVLPWDKIDIGITKQFFISEFENAKVAKPTKDCRASCNGCGLASKGVCKYGCS